MCKCIWLSIFVFISIILHNQNANGFDDLVSMVMGYDAANAILTSTDVQNSLEVSPKQVSELSELLARLRPEYEQKLEKEIRRGLEAADFAAKRVVDRKAIPELKRMLGPEQLKAWRLQYLRRNFKSPILAFQKSVLSQLEMQDADYEQFRKEIEGDILAHSAAIDESIVVAAKSLCSSGPANMQQRFAELFGVGGSDNDKTNARPAAIEVLPVSRPSEQLRMGPMISMPQGSELTHEQRAQLMNLKFSEDVESAKGQSSNREPKIRESIKQILNDKQQVRVIQVLQNYELREDFSIVLHTRVAEYLQLTEADCVRLKPLVRELDTSIKLAIKKGAIGLYDSGLKKLPKSVAVSFEELFADVWNTN